ncbi:hypothetical protein COCOBI_09-2500 [Coccomyxa sp. Obi]|nr:hypothetical protein COCOBI_09-2500 [Coccomyxa sp. Obi]
MADKGPCVRTGRIGGVFWPSLFDSLGKLQPICERSAQEEEGLLSEGPRGVLCNEALLNPAWVAPEDLQKPIRPSNIVEGSLQYYKAQHPQEFIPQNLQRELLEDANHSDELASKAGLLGNRVAATWAGINDLLICSPAGSIGETLKLSTLFGSHEERFQCGATLQAACSGMPIWQVCFNCPHAEDGRLMVAVRTPYWLCFFSLKKCPTQLDNQSRQHEVQGPSAIHEAAKTWELQPIGAVQTKQRLAHVCWNSCIPSWAAFSCEDGSLYRVDVAQEGLGCCLATAGVSGSGFPLLQAKQVVGPVQTPPRHGRLMCEWAAHPTSLLVALGQQLLQYDISMPEGTPTPRTLHTLADGDAFVALARPDRALAGPGNHGVAHLLAASTLKEVLLMDLRRPGQALLRWHHGMDREPPRLLALLPEPHQITISNNVQPEPSSTFLQPASQQSPQQQHTQTQAYGVQRTGFDHMRHSQFDAIQSQYGSSSQLPEARAPRSASMQQDKLGTQASQPGGLQQYNATQASQVDPPQQLNNAVGASGTASQQGQPVEARPRGLVAAANFAAGDVVACAFVIRPLQVCMHAQPPDLQQSKRSAFSQGPIGRIWASACSAPLLHGGSQGSDHSAGRLIAPADGDAMGRHHSGFSWVPRSLAGAQSLGLPRRICWPLQLHKRPEGALAGVSCPETAKELEAILKDAPDLQGVAFLAAAPDHSAAPEDQLSREMPSRDRTLMLRVDFLGHLHLERMRLPWAARTPAAGVQGVSMSQDQLLQGPLAHHQQISVEADYLISQEVLTPEIPGKERIHAPQLRPERPHLTESDLVCDLSVHCGIASKAIRDWRVVAGEHGADEPGMSLSADRKSLSSLMAGMKVPLTMWEMCMEFQKMESSAKLDASEDGREQASPSLLPSSGTLASDGTVEGMIVALKRRMRSIWQGVQAVEVGKKSRLSKWEKARSDTQHITEACFFEAHREVEECATGMPTQVRELTAAVSAAINQAEVASRGDVPLRYALREGLSNPASCRPSSLGKPRALSRDEEFGPDSQATTASQGLSRPPSDFRANASASPPLDRVLGNGTVLMPQTQLQSMFDTPVKSAVLEPQIFMKRIKVVDSVAAAALRELEKEWLRVEDKAQQQAGSQTHEPVAPAQGPQVVPPDGLHSTQQSAPAKKQKRVSFGAQTLLPSDSKPVERQVKKRRMKMEEGFS